MGWKGNKPILRILASGTEGLNIKYLIVYIYQFNEQFQLLTVCYHFHILLSKQSFLIMNFNHFITIIILFILGSNQT